MATDRSDVAVLVAAAGSGDPGAWNEILDRYTPLVVTVVQAYRLPRTEVQDLAQTVWLRLVEHLDDLREPRALPQWLATTARREALRQAQALRRTQPTDFSGQGWASRLAILDDADAALVRAERRAALEDGFGVLSVRQRELLTLLAQDPPLTYTEISRRTGIPVGAIGPTRARAVARLRRTATVRHLVA